MKWILGALTALAAMPAGAGATRRPMLHDPVSLNIGVNCQWQRDCIVQQRTAMKRALGYVATSQPPQWRVHLCNRNAGHGGYRMDWVGFDHCIRNVALRPGGRAGMRTKR